MGNDSGVFYFLLIKEYFFKSVVRQVTFGQLPVDFLEKKTGFPAANPVDAIVHERGVC